MADRVGPLNGGRSEGHGLARLFWWITSRNTTTNTQAPLTTRCTCFTITADKGQRHVQYVGCPTHDPGVRRLSFPLTRSPKGDSMTKNLAIYGYGTSSSGEESTTREGVVPSSGGATCPPASAGVQAPPQRHQGETCQACGTPYDVHVFDRPFTAEEWEAAGG